MGVKPVGKPLISRDIIAGKILNTLAVVGARSEHEQGYKLAALKYAVHHRMFHSQLNDEGVQYAISELHNLATVIIERHPSEPTNRDFTHSVVSEVCPFCGSTEWIVQSSDTVRDWPSGRRRYLSCSSCENEWTSLEGGWSPLQVIPRSDSDEPTLVAFDFPRLTKAVYESIKKLRSVTTDLEEKRKRKKQRDEDADRAKSIARQILRETARYAVLSGPLLSVDARDLHWIIIEILSQESPLAAVRFSLHTGIFHRRGEPNTTTIMDMMGQVDTVYRSYFRQYINDGLLLPSLLR